MLEEETQLQLQGSIVKEAAAYLIAIAAAEAVTMFYQPLWGVIGHAIIMAVMIVRSARNRDWRHRGFVLSLTLIPLIRIIDLSMILSLLSIAPLWRFAMVYIPVLVGGIVVMRLLGYHRAEVGLTLRLYRFVPLHLVVGFSGVYLGWLEYIILRPEPMISQFGWLEVLPIAVVLMLTTGLIEEFIFRGLIQHAALNSLGWPGMVYVSTLFAIMHMGVHSWLDVAFVFGVAMFFAGVVKRTGSLFGVSLAHGITNVILFLVIPFTHPNTPYVPFI